MQRRDVVVVIVCTTAVPTPLVQFPNLIRDVTAIVLWIENGNAVHGQRDRTTQEAALDHRGLGGGNRLQRDAPSIVLEVVLRQRDLLLPCRDPNHHWMIRDAIGTHIEKVTVRPQVEFLERQKRPGRRGCFRLVGDCRSGKRKCRCSGSHLHPFPMPFFQNVGPQCLPTHGIVTLSPRVSPNRHGESEKQKEEGLHDAHRNPRSVNLASRFLDRIVRIRSTSE